MWWEGEQVCPMYQYVISERRYLVWVDLGYSFYSSRRCLEEIASTLSLPLWDPNKVPDSEFVLYPLSSMPTMIVAAVPQRYSLADGDQVLYSSSKCDVEMGYECDKCGVWQVGEYHLPICYQCQFIGHDLLIGLGVDVDPSYISIANRSPGTVVRMDVPGISIILLRNNIHMVTSDQVLVPDLVIEEVPYKFSSDGSVSQLSAGIEQGDVQYVFWGKVLDYPEREWTLRYGDWARYSVYVYCGQPVWFQKHVLSKRERFHVRKKLRKKQSRITALQLKVQSLVNLGKDEQLNAVQNAIAWQTRKKKMLSYQLEIHDTSTYLALALVSPAPRLLMRRMMADWHDTTMQLTLAAVPLVEWIASIMPRTISSAKGVDDGRGDFLVEECEWL